MNIISWDSIPELEAYEPVSGAHHIGTTRMHADPKFGVVDSNCRIHTLSNLYLAGSSVFPTGGWATPTLTIVALALRLADHLKIALRRGAFAG
jgi:choline dehydrogenase-like flavoprotein